MIRFLAPLLLALTVGAGPGTPHGAVGTRAPGLEGATTLAGRPVAAQAYAGHVVVLNFWATWCPPCRAETSDLIAAYQRVHASDVAFLGVDTTETGPVVQTFLSAKGVPFTSALAGPDAYNRFGVAYIPTTIVIDKAGIVRARWEGGIAAAQLATYVAAARAGRSVIYISPLQRKIDALLAPAQFSYAGDAAARAATVIRMRAAIDRVDKIAAAASPAELVDDERTQFAEGALQAAAGRALRASFDPAERDRGSELLAEGDFNLNQFAAAVEVYRTALARRPGDPALVLALTKAEYRLHDYPAMIAQATRYTQLRPGDPDGWAWRSLGEQRSHRFAAAAADDAKSIALLESVAPAQATLAAIADESLDLADIEASLGNAAAVRRVNAQANRYADRLDPHGPYANLMRNVRERTQEALVAVALTHGSGAPTISVAPWTGPDLPGSVASTIKYRLIVAARPNAPVILQAVGLRPKWIASFCADGLCSPQIVSFTAPPGGVKTYEFQLVPPSPGATPGKVGVRIAGGAAVPVNGG